MPKNLKNIIFVLLLIVITLACNMPHASNLQPPQPTKISVSTLVSTVTAAPPVTPVSVIATVTPEFAPLCDANTSASMTAPAQCARPLAEVGGTYCNKKQPYNLIFVHQGATYGAQTPNFKCFDGGIKDGKQVVVCTGIMASDFSVIVCDPACQAPTAPATTTLCPLGYNYNNIQGCCAEGFVSLQQNCEVLKLRTTSCLVNCSEFTKESACDKNAVACFWDFNKKACEPRK